MHNIHEMFIARRCLMPGHITVVFLLCLPAVDFGVAAAPRPSTLLSSFSRLFCIASHHYAPDEALPITAEEGDHKSPMSVATLPDQWARERDVAKYKYVHLIGFKLKWKVPPFHEKFLSLRLIFSLCDFAQSIPKPKVQALLTKAADSSSTRVKTKKNSLF